MKIKPLTVAMDAIANWLAAKGGWRGFLRGLLYLLALEIITLPIQIAANVSFIAALFKQAPGAVMPLLSVAVVFAFGFMAFNLIILSDVLSLKDRSKLWIIPCVSGPFAPIGFLVVASLHNRRLSSESTNRSAGFGPRRVLAFFGPFGVPNKPAAILAASCVPPIWIAAAMSLSSLMHDSDLNAISIIGSILIAVASWKYLVRSANWLLGGAGSNLPPNLAKGAKRLALLSGAFVGSILSFMIYRAIYEDQNYSGIWSPDFFFFLPAVLSIGFLTVHSGVLWSFKAYGWVKDGFSPSAAPGGKESA